MTSIQFSEENIDDKTVHFTYKRTMDKTSLCQGDVLFASDDIKQIMSEVHPYFLRDQYKYFMVLTQSCDLVKRDGKRCKAPYITLAAVRSFDDFFEKQIVDNNVEKFHGLYLMDDKKYNTSFQLIERVYNNTEQGYFFLYKEELLDFPETMVAFLRVAISLKSNEHYDECLKAKVLELSDEFKAKLGWLIGDVYSRVGTTDWDSIKTKKEKNSMFEREIKRRCVVSSSVKLKELKNEISNHPEVFLDKDSIDDFLNGIVVESTYDQVMKILEECIAEYKDDDHQIDSALLMNIIRNKMVLKSIIGKK